MTGCNIVTISKVTTIDDNTVEFSKVYNTLLSNQKTELYLSFIENKKPEKLDIVYNILTSFTKDVVEVCYSKINDISIEIDYDEPMNELSVGVKLLLARSQELMDEKFFNIAVELSDKYEALCAENELYELSIDFNILLKNEYIRLISVEKKNN